MPTVKLKKTWPGNFTRSVKDDKGVVVTRLEFSPGEPMQVDVMTLKQLLPDIGRALELISETETVPGAVISGPMTSPEVVPEAENHKRGKR